MYSHSYRRSIKRGGQTTQTTDTDLQDVITHVAGGVAKEQNKRHKPQSQDLKMYSHSYRRSIKRGGQTTQTTDTDLQDVITHLVGRVAKEQNKRHKPQSQDFKMYSHSYRRSIKRGGQTTQTTDTENFQDVITHLVGRVAKEQNKRHKPQSQDLKMYSHTCRQSIKRGGKTTQATVKDLQDELTHLVGRVAKEQENRDE
ncbi:hypothetical protein PoB_004970500 [Plakobranchus ocellatus]|uniref:Uncharacterized protein n=1 Tax=Plakobranchus ocellatus TaxID=259542 RepID=A0AAV4BRM7_9GAST|nr:hypothetical protein PoB_004970500 [Plakobranchus ocellatus]